MATGRSFLAVVLLGAAAAGCGAGVPAGGRGPSEVPAADASGFRICGDGPSCSAGAPPSASTEPPHPSPVASCASVTMVSESVELAPFAIAGWQVPGQFPGFATPGWETDDIALKSNVVVTEVVRQEDGFRATAPPGVYPDGEIFTPFEVHVSEILHGSGQPGNLVIIIEGGAAGCEQRSVDIAPKIQVGRRYVLFLSGPVAGYPIVKAWAQAWSIDDSGLVQTLGGPMTIADLRARIDRLAATASPTPSAGSSARP